MIAHRSMSHAVSVVLMVAASAVWLTACAPETDTRASAAQVTERYEQAVAFLPWMVDKRVFGMNLEPQWSADGARLRYVLETAAGKESHEVDLLADGQQGTRSDAAAGVTLTAPAVGEQAAPKGGAKQAGPTTGANQIASMVGGAKQTGSVAGVNQTVPPASNVARDVVASPNGQWGARVIDGNLYRVELATGKQMALTTDGEPDYGYALVPQWASASLTRRLAGDPVRPYGLWSPDGHRFLTYRVDERGMYKLPHLVAVVPGAKHQVPYVHFQNTAWPDSERHQEAELMIFDLRTGKRTNLAIPKPGIGYGPTPEGGLRWSADGTKIFAAPETRDYRSITLYEADAASGRARAVLSEGPVKTALQPDVDQGARFLPVNNGAEFIVYSERSDWGHYYLYDGRTGTLKNAITQGEWAVQGVAHIDAVGRWLYFLAGGREPGHDPYYSHLYRVRFDGSELSLLTPEDAQHQVRFSPDGRFFVDTYSTVSAPPVHRLRANDGRELQELGRADISELQKQGWTPPRRFSVKAADDRTDIYGVLFLPADFDEQRRYPLIDATYGANFRIQSPLSFLQDRQSAMALAQLGFVVMLVDGRGTPLRSQSLQDLGFGRWDVNLDDHVAAIRQLAARHRFIDADRVGVYGHSAGGYSTVHAMLERPEIFKVGVASAGSHDFDLFIYPVNRERGRPQDYPQHFEPTNYEHADRLQGKLLLAHGLVDDNVHVAVTLQMADALIRANKDFDLFIHPTVNHQAFYRNGYAIHKVWNYFVEHLRHETPPENVQVPNAP